MEKLIAMFLAILQVFSIYLSGDTAAIEAHIAEKQSGKATVEENVDGEAEAEAEEADAEYEHYEFPEREYVKFSEMDRNTFDEEAADAALADMEAKCEQYGALEDLKADYDVLARQHDCINTDCNITYVLYCLDGDNDDIYDEYAALELKATDYADKMLTALSKVLDSQYAEAMTAYINCDGLIEEAAGYVPMTDEEFALVEENTELVDKYYEVLDSGSSDALYEASEIYLEILDNMIEENEYDGTYETYAQNVYATSYMRDYAPEDLELFRDWVRDFIIPYFYGTIALMYYSGLDTDAMWSVTYDTSYVINSTKPYLTSISPKAGEAFEFMLEYELYDLDVSDKKLPGGFTLTLSLYGSPYIFNCADGSISDISTLIHEFGHYYEAYTNMKPTLYDYGCYDTAEIDSQGLEALMTFHTAEIYGEEYADEIDAYNLYCKLYPIIDGVIFDEFQQRALEARMDGSLTDPDQLTELFLEIEQSYYGEGVTNWGEDWYQVHHSFDSPFYYISYATSATAALGYLMLGYEDYDAAVEKYNDLVEAGNEMGFCATLDYIGMPNPLTEEGLAELSEGLAEFFEAYGVSYGW